MLATENMLQEQEHDATETGTAVRVRDLIKRFTDGTVANDRISFDVERGEVVSILGPNGAGKTTLLRQLSTELRPTSGTVQILGRDAFAAPREVKRLMGIVPQEAGLFDSLRVGEHLALFARLKGADARQARRAACAIAAALDLEKRADKRIGTLSGGERRRVLVGLALIGAPPLLLLDEPTTGLDPESRRIVWQTIERERARGATIILSTHYMEEAERLSDRIAIICDGRLVAFGALDELNAHAVRRAAQSAPQGAPAPFLSLSAQKARDHALQRQWNRHARPSLEEIYFQLTGKPLEVDFD
ncbi:MAG: ABC transporter ATP-binding protein [Pyrinomonas sp.]|uniref:ABC transporter ATP-binding protein n=1 Tax=Pyrinomonas sp. TaxID=2080306 RepID=UPI003324950A